MLEGLDSAESMQTRDEQEPLTGLVTADEPAIAQTTFDAGQPPSRVGPQLQATLNLIPAHTWYANASGVLTFLNERGSDYVGLPKDHPLRLGIGSAGEWDSHIALLHPDDHEESRRVWSTCLSTGSAGQVSFRIRNAEGGYRWFLSRAEPVRASDGTLQYWIGINLDIEDRKQAEFYLAEGQRLAHMGSWAFNAAGFDYWSPELFRIYGLQPGAKAPTKDEYMALVHPEDRQFVAETIQKMFAEGRGFDFTKRIVRPDGKIRRIRCVGVHATHGGMFHGTGIDVTEQEQLTEELRRSEFYLAEGQRLGHAGSWSFKPDLTCEYWSRELYEILGFDPRNGIPTISDYFTRVHPEDRAVVEATIKRMIAAGEGCDLKKRIIRPDGVQRVIRCVVMAVREQGVVARFVGTLMDITEQEELTRELRRREAYLAEAQRLSHTGSWAWSPDTDVRYWSEECFRVLGFDTRDGLPRTEELIQRIHPDDQAMFRESARRAKFKKVDEEVDYRIVHPGGAVRDIHSIGHPVFSPSGDLIEYTGTVIDITERKRAEETIRRSEAYLAEAQRLTHTGSSARNPKTGKIHYWSEETYRIWGFDPRQPPPDSSMILQRIHPEDRDRAREGYLNAALEGKYYDHEYTIIRPDGAVRNIHVVGHPVFSRSGELIEYFSTHIDITERKRAEAAIRRSEAYLADAQKLSQTGSWAWSPEIGIKYWSEECYRVQGFDPQDGLPRFEELFQRIHPDDQHKLKELMQRAVREKIEFETDYRLVHPDGAVRDIYSTGHPVLGPSGDLIELMGTVIDITERKRAEEELRASERKYRNLVDTTPAFIHTASQDGALDFLSRGWQEYGGLALRDLKNWRWTEAIHPEDVEGFVDKWRAALASGEPFEAESRVRRADGEYCWFLQRNVPFRDETGKIVKWYGTGIDITERKRAENELRNSEQKYRHLVDTTPALVHTASPNGDLDFFNRGWLEYLGLPSKDLLGWRWTAVIHPEDVEEFSNKWRASLESGQPFVAESRVRRADGEYRWFLHRKQPQRNEAGEIVKWYGSSIEIEERKIAEEATRRGEAFLAEGQRLSRTGSWGWNASTGKVTWSQEHFRIFGLDPQDSNPSLDAFWEKVHPDDRIGLRRAFESATRDKRDFEQEFRIFTPDGSIRHLHGVGHAILNKANELVEFIGSTMDITEREELTQELRRREAYLAEAQRLSHTGSFGWNYGATRELTWSEETYRICGFDSSIKPTHELVRDRVHPDDRQVWQQAFDRAAEGEEVDFENRLVMPDGTVKFLHTVAYGIRKDGKYVEVVGTVMDITERKRAEAALQEARAELERVTRVTTMGELAASIAHEINQPLAGVVTSANAGLNWLAANPPNLAKTRETLERILRDGTRGGEVLARIRALLKRTPPAKTLVSVNQIVRDVLALTPGELRQHQIELSLDLAPTVPAVLGDTVQLQQVLLNLIKNAIEAMTGIAIGQRTLRIQSRLGEFDSKPAVIVEVSDTGVGFSASDSLRLFEAFHTTKPQGMGMGLWISRSIVESHHGRLTASPNKGPGATFAIILPKAAQEHA
jgi:PAS domain S-box-containing protein